MIEEFSRRRPYNAASEFIDANVARGLGGKVAFVDGERSLTYGELQARSSRFARALYSLGVHPEQRTAILLSDTVDFPVVFWGAIRAGVIPLPLNNLLTPEQYAYMLGDSRASALAVAAPLVSHIQPVLDRLPRVRSIVLVGSGNVDKSAFGGRAVYQLEPLLAKEKPDPFTAPTISDEVAFWLYTSGSTGDPKAVRHVHTSLMATAKLMGQATLGLREGDIVYSAAKLYFAYGLGNAMSFPMSVGATTVLLPGRATPDAVLALMRERRPSVFYGVPTLYAALLAHGELTRGAGSDRLRICVSAGEALPAPLAERWRDIVGVEILDGIGSTEMLQTFLSNRPGDIRPGSTGRPVPGYEMKIVDDEGTELPDGQIGELIVRGPSAGDGYWNHRVKSRRTFVGEWTHTGDKFYRDAEGYHYYCGRTDDMFKVSGMWVSPFEVEAALISHEAVLEAAVIGKEDGDGLIKPKAFVVLRNGIAPDDGLLDKLRLHVKERAGPWKYPRWIDVCPELPKTATGKIQRFKLRDQEAGASR
ncbi:MAG TPA: benzoate-CoA ligase family protein [Xanthobacteraceae bacterium]